MNHETSHHFGLANGAMSFTARCAAAQAVNGHPGMHRTPDVSGVWEIYPLVN